MPRNGHFGKGKSICVLLTVVVCFLVLLPKVFHPMLKVGFRKLSGVDTLSHSDELMLTPKIRQAGSASLVQKNPKRKVLSGKPDLHAHRRFDVGGETKTQSASVFNLLIPVYVVIMGSFLLYKILSIAWQDDQIEKEKNRKCNECYYYEEIGQTTTKMTSRQKARMQAQNPYESLPTYKAFNHYGADNVRQSLESLVRDMHVFRSHMLKAEVCRCKLRKCEIVNLAVKKCLDDLGNKDEEAEKCDKIKEEDNLDGDVEEGLKAMENQDTKSDETPNLEEKLEDADKASDAAPGKPGSNIETKENIPPLLKPGNKKSKIFKIKKHFKSMQLLRSNPNFEFLDDDDNTTGLVKKVQRTFGKDILDKINREVERLQQKSKLKSD